MPDKETICVMSEDITAYLAGELPEDEVKSFSDHLASCTRCRSAVEETELVMAIIRQDEQGAACDVTDEVMLKIKGAASPAKTGRVIRLVWAFSRVAAMLALAVMLGIAVRNMVSVQGGTDADSQAAVSRAAQWLVDAQESDGSWDPVKWGGRKELTASMTGLAMLSILRSGVEAEGTLAKAEQFLLSIQNHDGSFGPECTGKMYNHGIATKALLAMGESGAGKAGGAVDRALKHILDTQSPLGGWSYQEDDSRNSSIGVSVWQLDALMSAQRSGVKGLENGLRRGMAWLKGHYSEGGGFGYASAGSGPEMSPTVKAMGAMCMLSAGRDVLELKDDSRIHGALAAALDGASHTDLYRSYFVTSAAGAEVSADVARRVKDVKKAIAAKSVQHGTNAGSWDTDVRWGSVGGRVYATAMAALSLSN